MNICRICLSNGLLKDIFERYNSKRLSNVNNYVDMLKFCLDIQLSELSTTTTKLCTKCVRKLVAFYKFKSLALKNDAYLQNLHEDVVIKLEDISINNYDHIKSEEVVLCDDDIKEESKCNDSWEIKYEDTTEADTADEYTDLTVEIDTKDVVDIDTAVAVDIDTAVAVDIDTAEAAVDQESDDEPLSDVKKTKKELVITKVKGKRRREPKTKAKSKTKKNTCERQMCEECGRVVKDLKQHSHMHLPVSERKLYPCKYCGKVLKTYGSCKKHIKSRHLGIKQFCTICKKGVSSLITHTKVVHNKEACAHVCTICDRRFVSPSALSDHMNRHTKNYPYECDSCDKRFSTKMGLLLHVRSIHNKEKTFICQVCSKGFFKKCNLDVHMRTHVKVKPTHECPECEKLFISKSGLKCHLLLHGEEKKFECDICLMTFKTIKYLSTHKKCHSKEKSHPCQYCGVKFGRSDHRKRHEFTAHQKHLLTSPT